MKSMDGKWKTKSDHSSKDGTYGYSEKVGTLSGGQKKRVGLTKNIDGRTGFYYLHDEQRII